jgi:hypothetical protein
MAKPLVTLQRVRALITKPAPDQEVRRGELTIRGVAWSGAAQIARVEISMGEGSLQEAHLVSERKRHSWQWWELITQAHEPGVVTLRARATDLAGRTQPERAEWIRLGYGNPRSAGSNSVSGSTRFSVLNASPRYFLIDPRMGIFVQSRSCRSRYAAAGHNRP